MSDVIATNARPSSHQLNVKYLRHVQILKPLSRLKVHVLTQQEAYCTNEITKFQLK